MFDAYSGSFLWRFSEMKRLKGLLFGLLLFVSSLLGSVFILFPFVPASLVAPRLWRFCADRCVGYWLTFPASLCDFLFGTKFHITGDLIDRSQPAIIIMNHRTRLDWLFFWNALYKMDPWLLTTEKILLKLPLKLIPGAGWAMECASYMFLERNFENDKPVIAERIAYYKDVGNSYQLLLFPEGTDRGERAASISDAYARANNLPVYEYVLHPRTTGFAFLLQAMRKENYIKYVYDVTVGYPKEMVSREVDVIKYGRYPTEVHFDVERYEVDALPKDDENISKWLCRLWEKKEARLKQYYSSDEAETRRFTPSGERLLWPVQTTGMGYSCAFAFWIITSCMWIFFTYYYFFVRVYVLLVCAFYIFCGKKYGGFEFFALKQVSSRSTKAI